MVGSISDFGHFLLGMLSKEPMSGYDIKRILKALNWLIGSPSFGNLYPTLRRLLEEGLVTVETLSENGNRPRKIYNITQKGKDALAQWLDKPPKPNAPLKAFVMQLFLAGNLTTARLKALLEKRHAQVTDQHTMLANRLSADLLAEGEWQRLVLDYGITLAMAELAWLEQTLNRLSKSAHQQPLVMEVSVGSSAKSSI